MGSYVKKSRRNPLAWVLDSPAWLSFYIGHHHRTNKSGGSPMTLIISENGRGAQRLAPSGFDKEDYLQQYIYNNPDAIPVYEIDEDIRLLVLAREFATASGPIDALGVDQYGNIYLIETKLYKNPDKRTVVAQVLDYGASLWSSSIDFADFTIQLERHVQKQFDTSMTDKLQTFFELDDAGVEAITANMQTNLNGGTFKFVVLMDNLHRQLKDLILFMNRNSQFDVYAVELEYYKHQSFEIIIPRMFGAEVKKDVVSAKKTNSNYMTPATREDFVQDVQRHYETGELTEIGRDALLELHAVYEELADKTGGRTTYWHAATNHRDVMKFLVNDPNDKVSLYLDSDSSFGAYPGGKTGPQIDFSTAVLKAMIQAGLMGRTEKHLSGSQWFSNFKQTNATDDQIRKFIEINRAAISDIASNG